VLFVGDDWAEDHHDVELQDQGGARLTRARLSEGVAGIARLHELIAKHLAEDVGPEQVAIAIETDRGSWAQALTAAGYTVYAINPRQVARYREWHGTSGAKATPPMRTPWPTWCALTVTSYGRWPATASTPRRSRWWPGRTRR
jgi:hypothetical protein